MEKILLFSLMLFLHFQMQAGACEYTHTLTELLLDEEDSQIIILGKVKSMYFLRNGRMINNVLVTKVFRGENIDKNITVISGMTEGFQSKRLIIGDDYLIVGKPKKRVANEYSSFVCDRISGNILKEENGKPKNSRALQNLKIIQDYFSKKSTNYTGIVDIYRDTFLLATGQMLKGELHGVWKNYQLHKGRYYRQIDERTYKKGKLHGKSQYFYIEEDPEKHTPRKVALAKRGKVKSVDYFSRGRGVEYHFSGTSKYKYRGLKTIHKRKSYEANGKLRRQDEYTSYNFLSYPSSSRFPSRFQSGKHIHSFGKKKDGEIKGNYFRGAKIGIWSKFDKSKNLKTVKKFNKPKNRKAFYNAFFKRGELQVEGKIKNNKREGIWIYYNETMPSPSDNVPYGRMPFPSYKVPYENGLIHGEMKYFNEMTGELRKTKEYSNNMLHGFSISYDRNQNITEKFEYQKGKKHGICLRYYPKGNLVSEEKYNEGKPEGIVRKYHESGKISFIGTLNDAYSDWSFEEYDEKGKLTKKGQYIDGTRPVGVWTGYNSNGSKKVCSLDNNQPAEIDPIDNFTFSPCRFFNANNIEISEKEYLQNN